MPNAGGEEEPPAKRTKPAEDEDRYPAKSYVVVGGLRYVVPYLAEQSYVAKEDEGGRDMLSLLSEKFRLQRGEQDLEESRRYWSGELQAGRVSVKRRKSRREDREEIHLNHVVVGPDFVTERQDSIRIQKHVHERVVWAQPPSVLLNNSRFVVLHKPAGVPCVDSEDGVNNVLSVTLSELQAELSNIPAKKLHLCHRLDACVSGLLITARGGKNVRLVTDALARREARKTYYARVEGDCSFPGDATTCAAALAWSGRLGKALVDPVAGKPASTAFEVVFRVAGGGGSGPQTVVRASPATGLRHQIRVHLAHLGHPIVGDVLYGARPVFEEGAKRVYQDDGEGTLRSVLEQTLQPWCPKCAWVGSVLAGGRAQEPPAVEMPIMLHAARYQIAAAGLDVECPPPSWALLPA
eukprot:gene11716-18065_t